MFKVKSRVWIEGKDGTFLGEGRVRLLEQIIETGSISEAAKSMKMSYKKAWALIKSINSQVENPLVEKKIGGVGGGGTVVTEDGLKAIAYYKSINESCKSHLDNTFSPEEL